MIKGLAITPPIVGRISIGRVVEYNGKRVPQKDDQFTITTQVQTKQGWMLHPKNEELRGENKESKLRSIPIRLMFNNPDLNFRADYSLFDRNNGRPICVGNGDTCKRVTDQGVQSMPCPGADQCPLGISQGCKPYGRLTVLIGDDNATESFVFRTTGFNSIRTLTARLHYFKAVSNDLLACLPLELRLRGKSTRMSFGQPIYYADITLREGMSMEEALIEAQELNAKRVAAGFNQQALDEAALAGFNNGVFEETEEDGQAIVEEFYPHSDIITTSSASNSNLTAANEASYSKPVTQPSAPLHNQSLADKLQQKIEHNGFNHPDMGEPYAIPQT